MPQTSHRSSGTMAILSTTSAKPLCWEWGDPGHVTIQPDFFFNKDLEYLWYSRKIGRPALSISKMKAAYYPDVGLEQMVPDQMWIEEECKYDVAAMAVRTHMRILSVVRIDESLPMYGYNYMKKIVLRRADLKEYVIAERDFKYLYPNDHEFNEITKFSDGTLHKIDEALDYRVKEFRVNRRNPDKTYLLESGKLCWWQDKRRRLPTAEEDQIRDKLSWTSDTLQKPPSSQDPSNGSGFISYGRSIHFYRLSHSESDDIEKDYIKIGDARLILVNFRNSDKYYHDPEECEYAGPKVTTSHEGNIPQNKDNKRFQVDGDLKKAKRSLKFPMGTKITT
ncbi:hypothetical protein Tco_0370417 [Tanacetum coccineum]